MTLLSARQYGLVQTVSSGAITGVRENRLTRSPLVVAMERDILVLGSIGAAISLLVMRTFSKVVQRHEREAILQSPSAYGGPLLSRNDFSPNIAAIAIARRRRDALALARNGSSIPSSQTQAARRRKLARRSSWDYVNSANYSPSLFEDNASIRRREGLRAYDEEKERQQRQDLRDANPFADFHGISSVDVFDGEHGDIGRRKSGEGPFGDEEMMLDAESIHREMILQQPMIASPWNENPFTYVDFGPAPLSAGTSDAERERMPSERRRSLSWRRSMSPFDRRGSVVSGSSVEDRDRDRPRYLQPFSQMTGISTNVSLSRAGPAPAGVGARRGALVGQEVYVSPAALSTITPSPSPPHTLNGSAIELLEQTSRTKE